ncbi:MAG TPA: tetraacyldisaccharide 4'-kinase, partial [Thermoanaerobaculia bacterium]|nr:tetraacyldisaccharide 4'-kinase [Thermoanaerobaculia bacterium]
PALARADLVVVTRCEQADPSVAAALAARHAPGVPVYTAETEILGLSGPQGAPARAAELRAAPFVAVAGLAQPAAFERTLAALGLVPAAFLAFPDHVRYGLGEVARIVREAEASGAGTVVTTEKDAVKLESVCPLPLCTVAIRMRVVETGFLPDLLTLLSRRPS